MVIDDAPSDFASFALEFVVDVEVVTSSQYAVSYAIYDTEVGEDDKEAMVSIATVSCNMRSAEGLIIIRAQPFLFGWVFVVDVHFGV